MRALLEETMTEENGLGAWIEWLAQLIDEIAGVEPQSLAPLVAKHLAICESVTQGPEGETSGLLWEGSDAGAQAFQAMETLSNAAVEGGHFTPADYAVLLSRVLQAGRVRRSGQTDSRVQS